MARGREIRRYSFSSFGLVRATLTGPRPIDATPHIVVISSLSHMPPYCENQIPNMDRFSGVYGIHVEPHQKWRICSSSRGSFLESHLLNAKHTSCENVCSSGTLLSCVVPTFDYNDR